MTDTEIDEKAGLYIHGQCFHPDATPEKILENCNQNFKGHSFTIERIREMFNTYHFSKSKK